jgi:hypothetical protein
MTARRAVSEGPRGVKVTSGSGPGADPRARLRTVPTGSIEAFQLDNFPGIQY